MMIKIMLMKKLLMTGGSSIALFRIQLVTKDIKVLVKYTKSLLRT